ncbi:MAG: L,D-transpeptidase/peptidoglycan binding protein [Clostridiales bacterium]|nr:L,D-transpeptidase/peptidoglycan binding protein [Clostridiales bacterium]
MAWSARRRLQNVGGDLMTNEKEKKRVWLPILIAVLAVVLILLAVYLAGAFYFHSHFFPNTTVNGVDYSRKTVAELKADNVATGAAYELTVYDTEGSAYTLQGADFSYAYVDAGAEEALMEQQNIYAWPLELGKEHTYTLEAAFSYDEEALEECILALAFLNYNSFTASEDAELVRAADGTYEITEEAYGNEPIPETVVSVVTQAVASGLTECTLDRDCYVNPEVYADDVTLNAALEQIQSYCNATIQYDIGDADESLDAAEICDMLIVGEDYSVTIDTDQIAAYVQTLATAYNTYGDERSFVTSLGDTVTIGGGDYGWVIDKTGEAEQILADLEAGEPVSREPVYEQTALIRAADAQDIGDTYIELDYSNQHLYYYQEGTLVLDCDIVSGNLNKGNGSPDGIFDISYKKSPATLVGEDYESDVTYFMVFAYNVGIHDASWRSSFGGSIYLTNGSHGCININAASAAKLYSMLEDKTPVVAYYRTSVQLTSYANKMSNAYSYVESDTDD